MIEAVGLSKRFGAVAALHDVSLTVAPGEVLCLLGANGAGKTTLLNVLMGFVRADQGTASVAGIDVAASPLEARRRTGYVPEQVLLYDAFDAVEHLRFFAELSGQVLGDGAALSALRAAGLRDAESRRRLSTYSKGMRQKVALAIALSKGAEALLLDEPLSGLDPKSAIDLSARLRELSVTGLAVLLTTHDILRAREVATRLGIMRAGRLVHLIDPAQANLGELEELYVKAMLDDPGD